MERLPRASSTISGDGQPQGRIATLGNALKSLRSRTLASDRPSDAACLAATAGAASSSTTKDPSNPYDEHMVLYKSYARSLGPGHEGLYEATVRGWLFQPGGNRKGKIMMAAVERLVGSSGTDSTHSHSSHSHHPEAEDQLVNLDDFTHAHDEVSSLSSRHHQPRSRPQSHASSRATSRTTSRSNSRAVSRDQSPWRSESSDEDIPGYIEDSRPGSSKISVRERLAAVSHRSLALKDVHVTVYPFKEEDDSEARSFLGRTDDGGRFSLNCRVPFLPGEVKVLSGNIEADTETIFVPSSGISVISDIDDTVRNTGVTKSKREVLQNVLLKSYDQVKLEGVAEWYNQLASQGAMFHYVSNSPWQLYDSIQGFLQHQNFPEGSIHLKRYQGIFDGILEPAQGRKRAVLDSILRDFPSRKFILVGDSGEADLEAYAELARKFPEQILAIYIRDITLPPEEPQLQYEQLRRAKTEPARSQDLIDMHSSNKADLDRSITEPVSRSRMTEPPTPGPTRPAKPGPPKPVVPPRPPHLKPTRTKTEASSVAKAQADDSSRAQSNGHAEPSRIAAAAAAEATAATAVESDTPPPLPQRPPLPRRSSSRARLAAAANNGGVAGAVFGAVASASSAAQQVASKMMGPPVPPRPTPLRGSPRAHPSQAHPPSPSSRQLAQEPPGFIYSSQEPEIDPERIDKRVESWKMRFAQHTRTLPGHVRLRTWRNPDDVKEESLRLAKDPQKSSSLI